MRGWFVFGSLLVATAGCAKAPGEPRKLDRPDHVATHVPAALPPGELATEPAVGARKPPPPVPGPRPPLPPPAPGSSTSLAAANPTPVASGSQVAGPRTPPVPLPPAGHDSELPGPSVQASKTTPREPGILPADHGRPPTTSPLDLPEVLRGGAVTLNRFVICKGVRDREPVEPTNTFPRERGGQVWVFLDAANVSGQPQTVTVSFESVDRPGSAPPPISLEIRPGPRFRTWARASTWRPAGTYRVVVRDAAGTPLARGAFRIVEP